MEQAHSERLTTVDAAFLAVEDANAHMHIGSVAIFEAGPLTREDGGLDLERILEFVAAQIHKTPRFRQKIMTVPAFERPVWIDDPNFNLTYHIRHTGLPIPGDERQLKRLAGRIMSQQLDRGKPLWEQWFVEGVEGDRFAVVTKIHHCMADGISSGDALGMLMGFDPDYEAPPAPHWKARPAPTPRELFFGEVRRFAALPYSYFFGEESKSGIRWDEVTGLGESLRDGVADLTDGVPRMHPTCLNNEIGPHRRFDWTAIDLGQVREVAHSAGGKVNDLVLAVTSGALRCFLQRRGERVDDLAFRVMVPVSLRAEDEHEIGNRVSAMMVELPLDEQDPWKRLLRIVDETQQAKRSSQASAAEFLEQFLEFVPMRLSSELVQRLVRSPIANLVVTNVPGPQQPVYLMGARMLASYPVVPLAPTQGLGIALYSYDGALHWGFNSDWDALPDLHDFALEIRRQFDELVRLGTGVASS